MVSLEASFEHCRHVARTRAKNFYYSFVLLPREQRDAMCAVYAFMRYCDDLSDEPGAERATMDQWRRDLDAALDGKFNGPNGGHHRVKPTTQCGPFFCSRKARQPPRSGRVLHHLHP